MSNLQVTFDELLECLRISHETNLMLIQLCYINKLIDEKAYKEFMRSNIEVNRHMLKIEAHQKTESGIN